MPQKNDYGGKGDSEVEFAGMQIQSPDGTIVMDTAEQLFAGQEDAVIDLINKIVEVIDESDLNDAGKQHFRELIAQ
jgi:hypothetical protein